MRKRSELQKKIKMSTNHQTKENVLNKIKEIENNLKNLINTERNLRETFKKNRNTLQIRKKNNSKIRAGIGPLQDEEGNLEPSNKKMSELLNEQYNSVFSTLDPTITIKYPKDFFGHPQANAQSYINIAREDIIDAIKNNLTKLFCRPTSFSINTSQTMQQEPSPSSPTAV